MRSLTLFSSLLALVMCVSAEGLADVCPANTSVGTVLTSGFTCTLGDKTFSNISITGEPSTAEVGFVIDGPLFVIDITRGSGIFSGIVTFNYTISTAFPFVITGGTAGFDVGTTIPIVFSVSNMNGVNLLPAPITNSGSASITFSPAVESVDVLNQTIELSGSFLTSITNTFQQTEVPEPTSISMLGLGLAGFGFSWRRKRRN